MRSLSLKLSLIFAAIALVAMGVIALWVNHSVGIEFEQYYQEASGTSQMGAAEEAFLEESSKSLGLIVLGALIGAVVLGLVSSRLITRPLRRLTLSARGIARYRMTTPATKKSRGHGSIAVPSIKLLLLFLLRVLFRHTCEPRQFAPMDNTYL